MVFAPPSLIPTVVKAAAGLKTIAAVAPTAIKASLVGSSLTLVSGVSIVGGIVAAGLGIYALIKAREQAKARERAISAASQSLPDYRPPSSQEITPSSSYEGTGGHRPILYDISIACAIYVYPAPSTTTRQSVTNLYNVLGPLGIDIPDPGRKTVESLITVTDGNGNLVQEINIRYGIYSHYAYASEPKYVRVTITPKGQEYGRQYYASGTYKTANTRNNANYGGSNVRNWDMGGVIAGKILGAEISDQGFGELYYLKSENAEGTIIYSPARDLATGNALVIQGTTSDYGSGGDRFALPSGFSIESITPVDGQPDTGGDPPSTPAIQSTSTSPANTTFPYIPPERFLNANPRDYGLLFEPKKPVPIYAPERFTKATDYSLYKGDVVENPPISNVATATVDTTATNQQNKIDNTVPISNAVAVANAVATAAVVKETTKEEIEEDTTEVKYYTSGKTRIKETIHTDVSTGIATKVLQVADTGKVVSIKQVIPSGVTARKVGVSNASSKELLHQGIENPSLKKVLANVPTKTGIGVKAKPTATEVTQTAIPNSIGETIGELSPGALAAIAAVMFAPTTGNLDKIQSATEDAICNSSTGGCLNNNIKQPLLGGQNSVLDAVNAGLQGINFGLLDVINQKLGDKIPGGIGGYLKKAWEVAQVDKIINLATLVTATHNAAMLSRNLGETIGEVASQALNLFGIKDAEGNAIDVNQIIGNTISNGIKLLVPENIRTNVSETWLKASRIHSAAVAMAAAINETKDAIMEINEITGDWIAKIGNRLQEQGIVEEDSYPWMEEGISLKEPYKGFFEKLSDVEERIERASSFVNSAIELKDSVGELATSKAEIQESIEEFIETKTEEEANKTLASQSPTIDRLDLIQLEPDEI